ncbi:hypothetical protein XSR1_180008 [Xenorhabdus szentirmaii DSM 16338]|uniref:Uncharacterized protein n=1 Tax=Xenorhabdus szentirmaii DSM 16338 TaxID=1427518 RepID=W1IU64_9GAMM|nr:hypothetical protein XSR1_180008 [Xenorhabdus szentirmaii DSM 16338]
MYINKSAMLLFYNELNNNDLAIHSVYLFHHEKVNKKSTSQCGSA